MTNKSIISDYTYNLTDIFSPQIINDTPTWIANVNNELNGVIIVTFLAVFGVVLYFVSKNSNIGQEISDSEAVMYSGLACSVIGTLLFVIKIGSVKLLEFNQVLPFYILTAIAIFVSYINKNW